MITSRSFTEHDKKVLSLIEHAFEKVAKINVPVDPHKRFDADDYRDPYGRVIEWVHFVGTGLFRD
jgi:hypothetical protein